MKRSFLILIGLLFCQCSSDRKSERNESARGKIIKEKSIESNDLVINELSQKMSGKDAIETLKNTADFKSDFQNNNLGFKVEIDDFVDESREFHYLRTICKDENHVEKTISSYRISFNSGNIEKINSTGEWQRIN